MAIELKQTLRQAQQLVMTPQLQQAIKLLQLNQMELVQTIKDELLENPVLEEVEGEEAPTPAEISDETPGEESGASEAEAGDDASSASKDGQEAEPASGDGEGQVDERGSDGDADDPASAGADGESQADGEQGADSEQVTDAEKMADVEWENYMESNPLTAHEGRAGDDDRPSPYANLTRRPTLAEHLEWQLQLTEFCDEEAEAAHWIIGNLDERGYLCSSIDELAKQSGIAEDTIEAALVRVQGLDPTGVAGRDLRECLLLQIRALGIDDPVVVAIVEEHLALLTNREFRGLVRALGVPIEAVAAAAKVIGQLEPRPGRAFGGEDPVYITPDIYVHKIGDEFHIQLNEDGLPKLKVSNLYRSVLQRDSGAATDTRSYVHDKMRSAQWLIKSIHQRQRTIYKVMQSIIQHQREFFDKGVQHLRPLNLRDVADDIEMHESTVSRVTTNKYVHTPQGIFELKYFFNSSISRVNGDAIASESVKEKIRKIILNEDSRRPLSDQRIAEMLKSANVDIARRTVTKYREAMDILSSTKRRQVG